MYFILEGQPSYESAKITSRAVSRNQRFLKIQTRFALEAQIMRVFCGKSTIAGIMQVADKTLTMIASQMLYDNQKFLNAEKKNILLKKGEILHKIDRLTQPPSPKNIISAIPSNSSSSEPKMIRGGIKKKKDALVNSPSNISFNTLKRRLLDTPVIITPVHKRQS